jgi:ribokinase
MVCGPFIASDALVGSDAARRARRRRPASGSGMLSVFGRVRNQHSSASVTIDRRLEMAVYTAGTINADFLMRVEGRLDPGASVIAQRLLRTSGGRAGNVAVMVRRLDTPALLFGCVGGDDLARQALAGPAHAGVDLTGVRRAPGDTGLASIFVGPAGSKTMVLAAGANDAFAEADGDALASTLHGATGRSALVVDTELLPAALERALVAARARGQPTVLDPTRPRRVTDRLLALADHVTPNADEAALLTGIATDTPAGARGAAEQLRAGGAHHVHVRLAGGGCVLLGPGIDALLRIRTDTEVVDTTGAGDAYAGTLAVAILAGEPIVEAARLAVAAASCAVTGFGAQESYPDRSTLEAMARSVQVTPGGSGRGSVRE